MFKASTYHVILLHFGWGILIYCILVRDSHNIQPKTTPPQYQVELKQVIQASPQPIKPKTDEISIDESRAATLLDTDHALIEKFHTFTTDSKMYYIGVYESSNRDYDINEQRQRMQECRASSSSSHVSDCWEYAYRAEKNVEDSITIQVNSKHKISLILTSYDSVKWIIKGNTQLVNFVYLSGYHSSELMIPHLGSRKIYAKFNDPSYCQTCLISPLNYFHGYKYDAQLIHTIERYFGKPIDLFQGEYRAKQFIVN